LRDEHQRLNRLRLGDLEVRTNIGLGYEALGDTDRKVLRRLATIEVADFSAFTPGTIPVLLPVEGHIASTAICYEVIYPDLIRRFVRDGSELLTTITNDAWYGTTSAAYQHWDQASMRAKFTMTTVVRSENAAQMASLPNAVRDAIRRSEPDVAVEMSTLDQRLATSVADRRFTLVLLGVFAATALLLAATGVYSVLSQAVARRTQEIGIRMALGAEPQRVVRLMLGSAMRSLLVGIAVGAISAAFAVSFLSTLLFGVSPLDPLAFAAAILLIVTVALLAGYIPARRATRVDPLQALRQS